VFAMQDIHPGKGKAQGIAGPGSQRNLFGAGGIGKCAAPILDIGPEIRWIPALHGGNTFASHHIQPDIPAGAFADEFLQKQG